MEGFETQLGLAMLVPYILQWLKGKSWFPLLTFYGQGLNRGVSAATAGFSGIGIVWQYDAVTGTMMIHGLTLFALWHFAFHSTLQYAMNHTVYKLAIAPPLAGAVQNELRNSERL